MRIIHYTEVKLEDVKREGFKGVKARYVITEKEGAPHFAMRIFEFDPMGHTSFHQHPEEHEIFILDGEAIAVNKNGEEIRLNKGSTIYIPPNEPHQIKNASSEKPLKLICMIPLLKK